ncbi:MAG: PH domain-containing protein [Actinomycetota bacterium]
MEDPTPPPVGRPGRRPDDKPRRNRASLLLPQSLDDVKVENEDVFYNARQHWASVVQPVYETFIFLLFIIWIVDLTRGTGLSNSVVTTILIAAALHFLVVTVSGGRPPVSRLAADPFSNASGQTTPSRTVIFGSVIIIALSLVVWGLQFTLALAVIGVISRLIVILARWSFYERRYITNRRVIESGGFLGSRISSMPLSRVTDISYSRTVPGEILGYATMRVETAGQDQALGVVRYISDPNTFYDVLVNFSAPKTSPDDQASQTTANNDEGGSPPPPPPPPAPLDDLGR